MPKALFTCICEFDRGTYVSQVHAADEQQALRDWAALFSREQPAGMSSSEIARDALIAATPIRLEGLIGVWCWTATINNKLALVNLVRST